jgi:dTDP-4-dehydrorhamnose reductase
MNILILGSSGMLGKKIYKILSPKYNVFHTGLKKRNIDLTKIYQINKLLTSNSYDLIINCAAITNINFCEKRKKESKYINQDLLQRIFNIKIKKKLNFNLIHFSTDQMYNNRNNTEKSKIVVFNNYTHQKIKSEKICKKNKALIFRINFFDIHPKNFYGWLVRSIKKQEKIFLFYNIKFSPLSANTIAKIILEIIKLKKYSTKGIFNLGSIGGISKSKFGEYVIKYLNKKTPYFLCNSQKIFKIKRPENMIMNSKKFIKNFNIKLPKTTNEIKHELQKYKRANKFKR